MEFGHQKSQTSDDRYQWHHPEAQTSQNPLRVTEGEDHAEGKKKVPRKGRNPEQSPESPPEFQRSWSWSQIYTSGRANGALSYFQLEDEGPSSGGTKLSSTFITAEVTFTKPKQPT
ncbi:hypothetical protein Tco_0921552 [Tanacetum coccineum]